jgi:hypothetical protein
MSIRIGENVFVVNNKASKVRGNVLPTFDDHTKSKLYHEVEHSFGILAFDCTAGIVSLEVMCFI